MLLRRASFTSFIVAACVAACGGGGDEAFSSYGYSGTLSGGGGGSFSYTVTDASGSASGSATAAGGKSFTLLGYVTKDGGVNLQFQGQSAYNGWITGSQSGSAMSGSWYLSGSNSYSGSASATKSSTSGGGDSCTSLIGYWTEQSTGLNHWNFISTSQAQVIQDSTTTPGAVLTTDLNLTSVSASSITYMITKQAMTGSGGYDYSYTQAQMIAKGLNVGPFSASYTLANCKLTIGGQTYSH